MAGLNFGVWEPSRWDNSLNLLWINLSFLCLRHYTGCIYFMNILSCNPWTSHKWEMIFTENVISACQLLHLLEGVETWKISLLPTPFYLFLVNIPFKGHLLVWMSSRQGPTFIPCCLPWCSYNPKFVPIPIAVITINGLKGLTASLKAWQKMFALSFSHYLLYALCWLYLPGFCIY